MSERFTIVPAQRGGWTHVSTALATLFSGFPGDQDFAVVVERAPCVGFPYYVQFGLGVEGDAYAEAVSNDFIKDATATLDDEQDRRLRTLGWRSPDELDGKPVRRPRNYWRRWPGPAPLLEVATIGVVTLADVYSVRPAEMLDVRVHPGRKPGLA